MLNWKILSYCLILSTVILLGANATSVYVKNKTNSQETEAQKFINLAIQAESAYFLEVRKIIDNLNDLNKFAEFKLISSNKSYKYNLNVLNQEKLVQITATPIKEKGLKTYTGAVSFNNGDSTSILCESGISAQVIVGEIKLVDNKLECPIGFKIVLENVQRQALFAVGNINRNQQVYFLENSKFAENTNDFHYSFPFSNSYYDYKINLLANGTLAQVLVTPKLDNLKGYIGATLNNNTTFQSIVCASEQSIKNIPQTIKLINGKLECPTGFKIVLENPEQEGLGSIKVINRAQQAYFLEASKFTNNQEDLGVFLTDDYYDYSFELLDDGNLAQVFATPKLGNFKSYIGATVNNNGKLQSIICVSKQPTKDIPQSIKLVDGKLECPTGFRMEFSLKEQDTLNAIRVINRAQRTYFLETSKFSNNQEDLGILLGQSDYDYFLELLDDGNLAKVVAIPKIDNLRIYAGATVNNHGKLQSITCVSERPTNDLPLSIELVGGKLKCSAGFEELSNDEG
ncbi:MAG: type IV pilin-like G/H family protein [Waterburya sp.]